MGIVVKIFFNPCNAKESAKIPLADSLFCHGYTQKYLLALITSNKFFSLIFGNYSRLILGITPATTLRASATE